MIRSRLGALACAVLTTVAVGACARPAPQAPPPADAGVALPGDFGGSGPGTLLKATTLPLVDRRLVAASSIAAEDDSPDPRGTLPVIAASIPRNV